MRVVPLPGVTHADAHTLAITTERGGVYRFEMPDVSELPAVSGGDSTGLAWRSDGLGEHSDEVA